MLVVPGRFSRNAKSVREMGSAAETGLMLINYMCERMGIENLAGLDVLDYGCGVRFSETFLNLGEPIGTYTGIEIDRKLVDFLNKEISDPRFNYYHLNVFSVLYNPNGEMLDPNATPTLGEATFDIACMFSVITHHPPEEARQTFTFLHRHIRPDGQLFFSAFIHEGNEDYKELVIERPGLKSSYSLPCMSRMLTETGWSIVSVVDPLPNDVPIMTSFHCKPIPSV